ncbi:MAG: glycosyl hydrolase, partial [Lentisphaeria bacterium]
KEGGFGGSFLHSRIGLLTEYLSGKWFDLMAAGVKSSQALEMDAWFYDEDKWPSGFAGGIVPLQDEAFRARALLRVPKGQPVTAPDSVLFEDAAYQYACRVDPLGNAWFNGTSWVDLMNPAMVKAFIDCSYAPYVERFAGQPRVRGIFTDEPQLSPQALNLGPHAGAVSFSPVVPAAFKARTGRDLYPLLPALFAEVGDWRRVRLDYYRTIAACLEQAFSKQIGDYCAAHGMVWTGHYNSEDWPTGGMLNEGNLMQQYRHMQMPGIDALGLNYCTVHCGKVMTSVANQYRQPRRLSELFGISGHNLTFEDRMWITAWHTIMGVNFMCPHLSLYSMKGARKRDYPPTISYQQPYWRHNKLFEDFSARLCTFASVGQTVAEICLLHPLESNYIELAQQTAETRNAAFGRLYDRLMETHRNFDFGDEQIISEVGRAEPGRFVVGGMAYRIVIVPALLTLRASTLALLRQFAAQGGTVLVAGDYPQLVDGVENAVALAGLRAAAPLVPADADWRAVLNAKVPPRFTLDGADAGTVWTHLRAVTDGHTLQLSNTSRRDCRTLTLRFAEPGVPVALWNPVDGRCLRLTPGADGAYTLAFAPAQSWIVSFGQVAADVIFDGDYAVPGARRELLTLDGPWRGRRVDPNALTLDYASYSKDGGATWSAPEPVLAIYDRFAHVPYNGPLQLKYVAEIADVPAACQLVVEQPAMYTSVTVNGRPVQFVDDAFYTCFTFRAQAVAGLLRPGRNEIVLALDNLSAVPTSLDARIRYGSELESIYLVGDFAVRAEPADRPLADSARNQGGVLTPKPVNSFKRFVMVREADTFAGDLAPQGYPFYAGEFQLERTFEIGALTPGRRYLLTFPLFEAVVVKVTVNGQPCAPLFASPWEADVTAALRPGVNTVCVALTNSLRNLLGPHHHKGGELTGVGPASFLCNQDWPNSEPGEADWYDARLGGQAKLWRDDYYMIPFGLLQPPVLVGATLLEKGAPQPT